MNSKRFLLIGGVSIIGIIGLLLICCIFLVLLAPPRQDRTVELQSAPESTEPVQPTTQPIPVAPSPPRSPTAARTATPPPSKISWEEIDSTYERMTQLQRADYIKTLPGKQIHWTATVREVRSDGDLPLNMPGRTSHSITLRGVPKELALTIQRDQRIVFDAVIDDANDFLGLNIILKFVSLTK